ncbi:MAG: NUDIX domain-containing protein [Vampirovibrio sp.]|nr:NUDIX domain-containing protein [Vampirovibrio sp.]
MNLTPVLPHFYTKKTAYPAFGQSPSAHNQQLLSQQLEQLVQSRDNFLKSQNDQIIETARKLSNIKQSPVPVSLGQFKFNKLMGVPFDKDGIWEFLELPKHKYGVTVVPTVHKNGQEYFLFVKTSHPSIDGKQMIAFPSGVRDIVDSHDLETIKQTANRELCEETGYEAETLIPADYLKGGSNRQKMFTHVVLARGLKKTSAKDLRDPGEKNIHLQSVLAPVKEIQQWLKQQQKQGMLLSLNVPAGLYYYHQNRE